MAKYRKQEWGPGHKYYDAAYRIGYDFYCDIAHRVTKIRKEQGLTQQQLAQKAEMKLRRLQQLENVRLRWDLQDCNQIAKALGQTVDFIIGAEIDSPNGECLYLCAPEYSPDSEFYQEATSAQMAFLKMLDFCRSVGVRFLAPTERAYVRLVGVPVTHEEMQAKFPAAVERDEDYIFDSAE